MISGINFYLLDYTLKDLKRYRYKNLFILSVMALLVALVATTLFISDSMKHEYKELLSKTPDILITKTKAERYTTIDNSYVDKIIEIEGVSNAIARVWGEYYFTQADRSFKIIGVDEFEDNGVKLFNRVSALLSTSSQYPSNSMVVSKDLKRLLHQNYYDNYFNFILSDGELLKVDIVKPAVDGTRVESKPFTIVSKELARKILDYSDSESTDIAVSVQNSDEVAYIAKKISQRFHNIKVVLKDDLLVEYEQRYNYRSGFFLTIFTIAFFTFFVIIYDRLSGLNSEQKKEIGILKAIGWRVEDVLKTKLYEGVILSMSAYIIGIGVAFIYLYKFNAAPLKNIFLNNYRVLEDFHLTLHVDYGTLALLFFLCVPVYICATIIPSWIAATTDADEVMR